LRQRFLAYRQIAGDNDRLQLVEAIVRGIFLGYVDRFTSHLPLWIFVNSGLNWWRVQNRIVRRIVS
jgi:hypothetical protein